MSLTVFAGTFNPIHIAHLILAESVKTFLDAKKILFIPSYIPPHREAELAPAEHRLEMVKLAIANNPAFEASDIEFKLKGKSYTFNTIKHLYQQYPDIKGKINFIIGTDAFLQIDSWYKAEELADLVNFIVLSRKGSLVMETKNIKTENITYQIIEAPMIDISSSYIRQKIKNNESINYLVRDNVKKYIHQHKLYNT